MGIISCGTTLIDQGLYQGLSSVDWDTTPKTATFTAATVATTATTATITTACRGWALLTT